MSAVSTVSFSLIIFSRRQPPSAVIMIFDLASFTRSRIEFEENPPKMIECGAPILVQASIAIASSGIIGM